MDDIDFEALSEQLARIDPAELRYLLQLLPENAPVVKKIVQNALDEPISEDLRRRVYHPLYFLNLFNQGLLPDQKGQEKGKNF